MEVSRMVIKAKYQEMLRRFHVRATQEEIDLNMDRLREKVITLFNLTPNADLMLTYIDEDGDEVTLVDDDDLCDVAKQRLDPLRITVKLNSEKNGTRQCPSAISTPLKSQYMQRPFENCREVLETVPDPLYGTTMKSSSDFDLTSKASSPASGFHELIGYFQHLTTSQSDAAESCMAVTKPDNLERSKVDGTTLKDKQVLGYNESLENRNELAVEKFLIDNGFIIEAPSIMPGFNDEALESQNISIGWPVSAESKVVCDIVDKKEMVEEIAECPAKDHPVANADSFIEKIRRASTVPNEDATNIRVPKLNFSAFNPIQLEHVGGRTNIGTFGNSTSSIWGPCHCISKLRGLSSSPKDDWPIYSRPLENVKAFQSHPASRAVASNGRNSQIVDFHCGIFCDGCGVHPITGPRFKSKVKADYDLCMICYAEIGNAIDYMRIDRPVVYPHHVLYDYHGRDRDSVSSQDSMVFKVKSCLSKMDSWFIKDVNIADDTVMAPLTPFTKIWRLKNNGIVAWPKKTIICWIGGDQLSKELNLELKIPATGLAINQELDVAVDCIAPELPGKYESFWELASPSGQRFGRPIWIRIEVVASVEAKPQENIRRFSLNFPPLSSPANGPKMKNAVPESNTEDESSSGPSFTCSISHPIVDLSNIPPAIPSLHSDVLHPFIPLSDINLPVAEDEGGSFKSADSNEAVSMMSEDYLNLDDASGISEWETILVELS